MTQQSQESAQQPTANLPRVSLEDFIEAVTTGVRRAMDAEGDVAGYAFRPGVQPTLTPTLVARPPIIIGIIYNPPGHLNAAADLSTQNAVG